MKKKNQNLWNLTWFSSSAFSDYREDGVPQPLTEEKVNIGFINFLFCISFISLLICFLFWEWIFFLFDTYSSNIHFSGAGGDC